MRNVRDLRKGDKGMQGQTGLEREACRSRSIYLKDKKKNGLAMQEPGQEDGSQELERSGGGVQLLSKDNLAGGVRASREGRGRVEARISS